MALNGTTIASDIRKAFQEKEGQALDDIATILAAAVMNAIKSAKIDYTTGLTITDGKVTGKFEGKLT